MLQSYFRHFLMSSTVLIVLLIPSQGVFAQSEFFNKGESAYYASVGIAKPIGPGASGRRGVGVQWWTLALSVNDFVEFGISSVNSDNSESSFAAHLALPIQFWNGPNRLGISLEASLLGGDADYSLGGSIYTRLQLSPSLVVLPIAGISVAQVEYSSGDRSVQTFSLGVGFGFGRSRMVLIGPQYLFTEDLTNVIGVSVGLVGIAD